MLSATQLFRGKSRFRNVSIRAQFDASLFPPKTVDCLDDFDKRFQFVTPLVFVMNSWKGDKPAMLADDLSELQLFPLSISISPRFTCHSPLASRVTL
jgi:hypothetical protein